MKKIVVMVVIMLGSVVYADFLNEGMQHASKGEMVQAKVHFEKACQLGDLKGCEYAKRFK